MYSKPFIAGWGDMDSNAHMRNTAFLDRAADVRMMFFADSGFEMKAFAERRLGPVIARDEIAYFSEVGLLQPITVTLHLAGLAADGSRFLMRNDIVGPGGKLCARIDSTGGLAGPGGTQAGRAAARPAGGTEHAATQRGLCRVALQPALSQSSAATSNRMWASTGGHSRPVPT